MRNATIRERLHQVIHEYGLPYAFRQGDVKNLREMDSSKMEIVGFLEESFEPEVIACDHPFDAHDYQGRRINAGYICVNENYAGRLARASHGAMKPEDFLMPPVPPVKGIENIQPEELREKAKKQPRYNYIRSESVEVHTVYDKENDRTWYFVMPSRKAIKAKLEQGEDTLK
jgi:hypothetical protein